MTLELKHAIHVLTTLKNLGLKNLTQFNLLCQCLSPLATAVIGGQIESLAGLKNLLAGVDKKLEEPKFGKLQFVKPVTKGKTLVGIDFVAESKEWARKDGKETLGQEAYEFYKMKENWHLMPYDPAVQVVVFCDAQFESGGDQWVRCLFRGGAGWGERNVWLADKFSGRCVAAVSQGS